MQWDTGQIFEILSVGDGFFMYRVLMAVAMMWNSGIFASLGALGLLFGLLIVGAQTVSSGGQKMDLGSLFTGFILWAVLFGGGATVQVTEVGFTRPGSTGQQSYVIDDVPFGVAAIGWAISTVGKEMTETMEQAYGLIGEPTSVLQTGNGRTLDWLASVRFARNINIGSTDNQFAVMRANLISYMRYCSAQAVVRDPDRTAVMPYAEDPLDDTNGFGFSSNWVTTDWYTFNAGGKPTRTDESCTVALTRLRAYYQGGTVAFQDFANTVARPMGYTGSTGAAQQATDAAASLNIPLDEAQKYMLGTMMAGLWNEAISGSPLLTDEQVANRIMITQAVEQRATEAAGEESMFRRTMFPLMTFLECTLYICAPFMALAVGLGRAGLGIAAKYAMTALWVALWLPTLAVINMFQLTSFEATYDSLIASYTGADAAYRIGSIAASTHIEDSVLDWMATGSMLAAAVPMISLVFLTGSAYSMTSLAGSFKGNDVLNEKLPSPDVANAASAMNRSAMWNHSGGEGSLRAGASLPSLEYGNAASVTSSRQFQAAEQAITDYAAKEGRQVASSLANDVVAGVRGSDRNESRASMEQGRALEALRSAGVNFDTSSSDASRLMLALGAQANAEGGISTKSVGKLIDGLVNKAGAGDSKAGDLAKGLAGLVSVGVTGSVMDRQESQRVSEGVARLANQIGASMRESGNVRAGVTNANVAAVESYGQVSGTDSAKLTGSDDWSRTRRDLSSASDTYSQGSDYAQRASSGQRIGLGEAAQHVGSANMANRAIQAAIETHGAQAYSDAIANLDGKIADLPAGNQRGANGEVPTQRQVAAALSVLNGTAPTDHIRSENVGAGKMALQDILSDSGTLNTTAGASAATADAPSRGGLGSEAEANMGQARSEVSAKDLGAAPGTEARAAGATGGLSTGSGRAAAMAQLGGMGLPVGEAVSGGGAAASYRGSDGGFSDAGWRDDTSSLRISGQGQLDALETQGSGSIGARNAALAEEAFVDSPFGTEDESLGAARLRSVVRNSGTNSENIANGNVDSAIAAAAGGAYTREPLTDQQAVVIGSYAASNGGHPLSREQAQEVVDTYNAMPENEQLAVRALVGKWSPGEEGAKDVPVNTTGTLGRAFNLEDVRPSEGDVTPRPELPSW